MARRQFAWVSIDALRELVEYADLHRGYLECDDACSAESHRRSDEEFKAKVAALGVEELDH
jgi:hypothetical protein